MWSRGRGGSSRHTTLHSTPHTTLHSTPHTTPHIAPHTTAHTALPPPRISCMPDEPHASPTGFACQVHLSWSQKNIAAIFYVNDTLSHSLLDPAARGSRAKRLADQTKLLPPLARGGSEAPESKLAGVARQMRDVAAAAATSALAMARRAQQQLGVVEGSGSGQRELVYPPIVQLRLSRECFDTEPLSQRLAAAEDRSRPEPYQPGCELPEDFLVEPPPLSDAEAAAQDSSSCGGAASLKEKASASRAPLRVDVVSRSGSSRQPARSVLAVVGGANQLM